jgi:hypothetical protein
MGWGCRTSVLAPPRLQNGRHGVRGKLRPANGYERANDVADHVPQKPIRTQHKDQALGVSGNAQAEETAPWVACRAGSGPEGRKIVTSQEDPSRRTHGGKRQRLWHMPGIGST